MMDGWDGWMAKIIEVGKLEVARVPIKKLLNDYDNVPETIIYKEGSDFSFYS